MMTLNGKIEVQQMFPMNYDYRPWTIFEKNSLPKICIDKKINCCLQNQRVSNCFEG